MLTVTVVIPIGPGHERLAQRAAASVDNQTYAANVVTVYDKQGQGPGWARNEGLKQVNTDYVMFLDADDWLEPEALAKMMALAGEHPTRYVYSDWWRDIEIVETPNTGYAWCGGTWHPITALIPTNWAREIGGFDETLPGGEDTDFYLRLITTWRCGIRLAEPLVHYSPDGQRAVLFHKSPEFKAVMQSLSDRYGGSKMACCGRSEEVESSPVGERQAGDVLAAALWGGNRVEHGRATGRPYPRTGNGKTAWVHPADIQASPNLWREVPALERVSDNGRVVETAPDPDALDGIKEIAGQAMAAYASPPKVTRYEPPRGKREVTAPDVADIIRMAGERV